MAEYKVHKYEPRKYSTKISIDPKVKFYEPVQSANDYKPILNKPVEQKKTELRTYDKVKNYNSYSEYVPPWSRGKEKGKKTVKEAKPPPPPPPKKQQPPPKVSFAPVTSSKEPSLSSLGTVKRMLLLFTGPHPDQPPNF